MKYAALGSGILSLLAVHRAGLTLSYLRGTFTRYTSMAVDQALRDLEESGSIVVSLADNELRFCLTEEGKI